MAGGTTGTGAGGRRPLRARSSRSRRIALKAVATLLIGGGATLCGSVAAFGSSGLNIAPNSGLLKGQIVSISASGLPPNSKGWLVECNNAPNEPTAHLGSPVNDSLPVGCSAPSLKSIYVVNGSGNLQATFSVKLGRIHVGPPCGPQASLAGCPSSDSAGGHIGQDAQKYPCPPTPKQQVAGVTCQIVYLDQSGQRVAGNISFAGGGPPFPTTTVPGGGGGGGGGGGTTTTAPGHTTTTVAHTTTTLGHTVVTTTTPRAVTTGNSLPRTTTAVTPAVSAHLAYTGPGPVLELVFAVGLLMALVGGSLWLTLLWRRPAGVRRHDGS